MTQKKAKGLEGNFVFVKLPEAYIEQLRRRFGDDLSGSVYELQEATPSGKLIITPKIEQGDE